MPGLQAAQRDILAYTKGHSASAVFHSGLIIEIKDINIPTFQRAIEAITLRHDALRSHISLNNLEPYQHVHPSNEIDIKHFAPLQLIDATNLPHTKPIMLEETLQKLGMAGILNEPFQLGKAPLWRSALVKFNETTHQFLLLAHHAIMDGASFDILFNDLSTYYNAFLTNTVPNLPAVPPLDENLVLEQPDAIKKRRLAYWKQNLANLNILKLPTDKQENGSFAFIGKRHHFHIDAELITSLKNTFPGQSINNLFLGALSILCYRYTGGNTTDLCLGTTSANRRHDIPNINHLVHCLFNSLAIRLSFSPSTSFNDLLLHIKEQVRNALQNQLSQIEIYQDALSTETKRSLHTASPFSIMFTASPFRPTLNLNGSSASHPVEPHIGGHTRFSNFGIYLEEQPDGSQASYLEYNTERFTPQTIERMIHHLLHIFKIVSKQPDTLMKNICFLQPEELEYITKYNQTEAIVPFKTLPEILAETSKKTPHTIAYFLHHPTNSRSLTFMDLDLHSSKLANYLLSQGHQPGHFIGVCLPRSPELIISIFAILKAGMVLVTLEKPASIQSPFSEQLKALNAIITNHEIAEFFPEKNIINFSEESTQRAIQASSNTDPRPSITPESPAYIMYSSGTTDIPKGVLIAHNGLSNLLSEIAKQYPCNASLISTADFRFDAAIFDLALMALGNTMHLIQKKKNRYSPTYLNQLIRQYSVKMIVTLPSILDHIDPTLPSLDYVTSSGEKPNFNTLKKLKDEKPTRTISNGYGPTENTICTTIHPINDDPNAPATTIGQPIQNTKIFIIDNDGALCPIGIPGQLVITGPGVALGYTNNPERNAQDFKVLKLDAEQQKLIPATPQEPGAMRCYFTGDLGHYYLDSRDTLNINFISRMYREIKIRGVTINLDVLETAFHDHPEIKDVFIHTKDNENLFAFVIPKDLNQTRDERILRLSINQFLQTKTAFPRVAYPRDVIIVREFIFNANGKIDISSLPYTETYTPPLNNIQTLNPLEAELLRLTSTLLKLPAKNMDLEDSFYVNGGDSILVIQLESLLNNHPVFTLTPPVTADELLSGSIKSLTTLLTPRCQLKISPLPLASTSESQPPPENKPKMGK